MGVHQLPNREPHIRFSDQGEHDAAAEQVRVKVRPQPKVLHRRAKVG